MQTVKETEVSKRVLTVKEERESARGEKEIERQILLIFVCLRVTRNIFRFKPIELIVDVLHIFSDQHGFTLKIFIYRKHLEAKFSHQSEIPRTRKYRIFLRSSARSFLMEFLAVQGRISGVYTVHGPGRNSLEPPSEPPSISREISQNLTES